jgi:hypothetical protein
LWEQGEKSRLGLATGNSAVSVAGFGWRWADSAPAGSPQDSFLHRQTAGELQTLGEDVPINKEPAHVARNYL